jgi:acyl carrier protein
MNAERTEETRARVRGFVVENFYVPDPSALADDASLIETGVVDSTGILEVLAFLEQSFAIRVEDAEVVPANLDSIQNIVAFVERKRRATATAA